jgi:Uncharacterized conserved protein
MKRNLLFIMFIAAGIISGCSDSSYRLDNSMRLINEPVFMTVKEFRSQEIKTRSAREIKERGKMCFYAGYIYISEPGRGIHIIDNRDPHKPKSTGFVELDGNTDIAIRDNKLYADSYIDLLWFDLSNPERPVYSNRLEDVFEFALPPVENDYFIDYYMCNAEENRKDKVIVGWKVAKRKEAYIYDYMLMAYADFAPAEKSSLNGGTASNNQGINGSMSRFSLYKDYLYTVINNSMSIFDLSKDKPEKAVESLYIGGSVETIFSYGENMFMGTPTGMIIYSVKDPLKPEYMSMVWHVFGCDPVVVEDDIAYVTIHSGNFCGQNTNELIVIDVKDVKNPTHIVTYTMKSPKGLGIDNGTLFVCDDGLKVFKATEPQKIMANQLAHYSGMDGFDVIPFNNVLMMIADDGLYQYDYTDVNKIKQISKIKIGK